MITVISLSNNFAFKIFAVVDSELPSEIPPICPLVETKGKREKQIIEIVVVSFCLVVSSLKITPFCTKARERQFWHLNSRVF